MIDKLRSRFHCFCISTDLQIILMKFLDKYSINLIEPLELLISIKSCEYSWHLSYFVNNDNLKLQATTQNY